MDLEASFFQGFFAALDGDNPESSMAFVSPQLEFAILWAADDGTRSRHFTGGPAELRGFTAVGDMDGWAHHILQASREGSTEIALGETRWHGGRHIGTFVCAAELDEHGLMRRYLVARSPFLSFTSAG